MFDRNGGRATVLLAKICQTSAAQNFLEGVNLNPSPMHIEQAQLSNASAFGSVLSGAEQWIENLGTSL